MALLGEQIALAETEDEWDKLLTRMHGIQEDEIQEDDGNFNRGWAAAPRYALHNTQQMLRADYKGTNKLTVEMFKIVEKEKALVEEAKLERERHKQGGVKPPRSQQP